MSRIVLSRTARQQRAEDVGLAIGDAVGMPTQTLTIEQIVSNYDVITGFVAPFTKLIGDPAILLQITGNSETTTVVESGQQVWVSWPVAKKIQL